MGRKDSRYFDSSISETMVYIIEVYIPQAFAPVTPCNYCSVSAIKHPKPSMDGEINEVTIIYPDGGFLK